MYLQVLTTKEAFLSWYPVKNFFKQNFHQGVRLIRTFLGVCLGSGYLAMCVYSALFFFFFFLLFRRLVKEVSWPVLFFFLFPLQPMQNPCRRGGIGTRFGRKCTSRAQTTSRQGFGPSWTRSSCIRCALAMRPTPDQTPLWRNSWWKWRDSVRVWSGCGFRTRGAKTRKKALWWNSYNSKRK